MGRPRRTSIAVTSETLEAENVEDLTEVTKDLTSVMREWTEDIPTVAVIQTEAATQTDTTIATIEVVIQIEVAMRDPLDQIVVHSEVDRQIAVNDHHTVTQEEGLTDVRLHHASILVTLIQLLEDPDPRLIRAAVIDIFRS